MTEKKRKHGGGTPKLNRGGLPGQRAPSMLATSEAVRQANIARRGKPLILGNKEVKPFGVKRLSVKEMMNLKIDTTYQRDEITSKVNEIIHVLREGGQVPDPISVAIRPDGDMYIVDGQQRWWAHVDCEVPIEAKLFRVQDYESEVKLFNVLNNNAALGAKVRVRAWPGPTGSLLHYLNEDNASALKGMIDFKSNRGAFTAVSLVRGLNALFTGTSASGGMQRALSMLDRAIGEQYEWGKRAVLEYATLVTQVFEDKDGRRMASMTAVAFGQACHQRWGGLDPHTKRWPFPSGAALTKLRKIDWKRLFPTSNPRWLPVLTNEIDAAWR